MQSSINSTFLFLLLPLLLVLASSELLLVQEVFRHGARYPIYPKSVDNTTYATQLDKVGELTNQGKRMHYLLGRRIYQEYWSQLFPDQTALDSSLFYIKSTDVNRTIESVQSHLKGFMENLDPITINSSTSKYSLPVWNAPLVNPEGPVFTSDRLYKPLVVHVEKAGSNGLNRGDPLKLYSPDNCPMQRTWGQENYNSSLAQQVLKNQRIQAAIKQASIALGYNQPMNIATLSQYYDSYVCSKYLGRTFMPFFEGDYSRQYAFIYTYQMYLELFYTPIQINSTITLLLNATLQNYYNLTQGRTTSKFIIYSAHDTTIGNFLAGLRLTSAECIYQSYLNNKEDQNCEAAYPTYTSNIITEFSNNSGAITVRFRYNGKYKKMIFCNYSDVCSLAQVEKFVADTIRPTFMDDCGIAEYVEPEVQRHPAFIGLVVGVSVASVGLLAAVGAIVFLKVKAARSE